MTQKTDWRMLIDGKLVDAKEHRAVSNPATGETYAEVPEASAEQVAEALAAARKAQRAWGHAAPIERAAVMKRIAAKVREQAEELARIVVSEQGKPILEARGEAAGTAEFFDYFAEFARRIQGEILPSDHAGEQVWIQRVPVGVVAAIIPWNYPLALVARKVAPAMIAGDTIVLKPHEETPVSALAMARIFDEAGVPSGVVNIVTGAGESIGEQLCTAEGVDLISMTGSVPTGKRIMRNAAERLTPVSLELGGKAPFIVMADCDLDLAVRSALTSRFMNCGQVCICNERTYVERPIYEAFIERFVEASRTLRIGDPMSETTDIGPKVSREELEKVARVVQEARGQGARVLMGGGAPESPPTPGGNWFAPTVLADIDPEMAIMQNEIFGPVVPILPFDDFDSVLSAANNSRYGLSAYLFTNDLQKTMRAVADLDFGELYINRVGPESLHGYHVGYRESGIGGEDGIHGLDAYLKKKTVYVNTSGGPATGLMPYGG